MAAATSLAWSHLITDDYADMERLFDEAAPAIELTGLEGITWTAFGLGWCAMVRAEHERCVDL